DTTISPVRVSRSGDSVRVAILVGADSVVLGGAYSDSVMMGSVTPAPLPGARFILRREADVTADELRRVAGDYRLADGSMLSVTGGGSIREGLCFLIWRS